MYRIILIMPEGGYKILTRSVRYDGMYYQPIFTADASDKRIKEYGTRHGALKYTSQLRKRGWDVLVIDSAEGAQIPESEEMRTGTTDRAYR